MHPLGTVLGRGEYNDFLVAYQRVGIGSNHDAYPRLGAHLTLRPGSSVLGACKIGDRCQIAAESLLLDRDLPDDTLYIGSPGSPKIRTQTFTYPLWRV